jgi:hypothetical protein
MRSFDMRPLIAVPVFACLLLASAFAPAPAEAQRTGTSARGVGGPGSIVTTPPGRVGIRVRPPTTTTWYSPSDPFYRSGDRFPYGPNTRPPTRRVRSDVWEYPLPFIYYYPVTTTRVIHVQSDVVQSRVVTPRTATVTPESSRVPAVESCAIVTVLEPNYRGYWKELRLPVAGARNTDELQRVLDARVEEGVAFTIRDAGGVTLDIPARAALDRIVVDRCR